MRQRARRACLACRRRKRKCDGQHPCKNCEDYEYQCVYHALGRQKHSLEESSRSNIEAAAKFAGTSQPSPPAASVETVHRRTNSASGRIRGFFDLHKSRYFSKESSVSFPRSLAIELQTSNLPRLHAFAYHAGVRPEPTYSPRHKLTGLITLMQVNQLIDIYESIIHPVFGFLELATIRCQCDAHWKARAQGEAFEAIVSGIAGLASLFSNFLTQQVEATIVEHAKILLESPFCISPPNVHWVMARILRTIYLRATSRPWTAWLCSSTTMHLAEAVGLHRSAEEVTLVADSDRSTFGATIATRERTFQVARSLNLIISYDYGRSSVNLGALSSRLLTSQPKDLTDQFCGLVCIIGADDTAPTPTTENTDLLSLLEKVSGAPADHDFIILTRAELVFCIYRRLHYFGYSLAAEKIDQIIEVGLLALQAARRLAALNQPWWNVLGTVFHFVCILLSINTNSSLDRLPEALETLEHLSQQLNTHISMEAVQTAHDLVRAALNQRRKATQSLENALRRFVSLEQSPANQVFPENSWDMFLQPFDQNYFPNIPFTDELDQEYAEISQQNFADMT